VKVSPEFSTDETVYVVGVGPSPVFYRSTDGGNDWDALSNQAPDILLVWQVVDSDTVLAAAPGHVYYTTNHGRRAWEDEGVDDLSLATCFSTSPNFASDDTILLGDNNGQIFISEDIGESWDQVGSALTPAVLTDVTFDVNYGTNDTIYAASGNEVARCVIDTDDSWADQEWKEFTTAKTELDMGFASGLKCSADGTLYAVDIIAANVTGGGGVWRTLNPTADMGDVVFELVGGEFGLDDGVNLGSLQLTAGSNTLWSMNLSLIHI